MTTNRFAVIGNPIEHSLSPEIHQAFAKQVGIRLTYSKLFSEVDQFTGTVNRFVEEGGTGLNVTAPFKQDAYAYSNSLSDAAKSANAVNTLHAVDGQINGFNTDGIGLVRDLKRLHWNLDSADLLVLGAGGATQGILQPLLDSGAQITVANRTLSKADALLTTFPPIRITSLDKIESNWSIVINATAAGWHNQALPIDVNHLRDAKCYDLGYAKDGQTTFIQQIESMASETSDGLGMLVEQAAESFYIWHGIRPSTENVLSELRQPVIRFIAGAVCPSCKSEDSIYVELDLLGKPVKRRCTQCGFNDDPQGNVGLTIQ